MEKSKDIFEYFVLASKVDYISDLRLTDKWIIVIEQMDKQGKIKNFPYNEWKRFFTYVSFVKNRKINRLYGLVKKNFLTTSSSILDSSSRDQKAT